MASQLIPGEWRIPSWIKTLGVLLGALLVVILILYLSGNGETLSLIANGIWEGIKAIWLWMVGLAGGILALFQGNRKKPSVGEVKQEIKAENEQIGLELKGLRDSMDRVDQWREKERQLHEREVALLERELALKEQQLQLLESNIKDLASKSGKEFFESLPEETKKEITEAKDKNEIDL